MSSAHSITLLRISHETQIAKKLADDDAADRAHRREMRRNELEHEARMRDLEDNV